MTTKFYTKVIASEGFWEKIIVKQIEGDTLFRISNNISNELIITSTGKTALDEIIKLSAEYSEEIFKVRIEEDDACNNYVRLYECSKGASNLVKEGYEYYFKFNIPDSGRIDPHELVMFKHEAVQFLKNNEIAMSLNQVDYKRRNKWSVAISYETKDVRLTATKKGLTCINIDVKFLDYEELPF